MKTFRTALQRKAAGFTLVEIMIVVLIIGIILAIAIPNFISARESARSRACIANLKQVDAAKQQYIMDYKQSTAYTFASDTTSTWPDLEPTYIRNVTPLSCPAGGTYTVGNGNSNPTCNYVAPGTAPAHALT